MVFAIFVLLSFSLQAATVAIPYNSKKKPAVDLVTEDGTEIDSDEAFDLENNGKDLSLLNPAESDIWCKDCDHPQTQFPADNNVNFYAFKPSISGMFRFNIEKDGKLFSVVASLENHAALLRHNLLTKLGYNLDQIKHQSQLKIKFKTIKERNDFLDTLSDYTLTTRDRWVANLPENEPEVTLQDLILEPGRITLPQYHWGIMREDLIADRRIMRALIIPFILGDIGESINLFSWDIGKVLSKQIVMSHPYGDAFKSITLADARWVGRILGKLEDKHFREIVKFSNYPDDVAEVLINKLISRRNELIKLLKLKDEIKELPFKTKINVGSVVDGKVTQENYPGYAIRFHFEQPESPLRFGEMTRYLVIKGIGTALAKTQEFFNDMLNVDTQEAIMKHQQKLIQAFLKHLQEHPGEPYQVPIKAYAAPYGGGSINMSRDVVSGTFYGSEYPVQLVDSFGVSANIGLFMGVDGTPPTIPTANANAQIARNYIHIRPIDSIKTGLKTNWSKIFVPSEMWRLQDVLEEDSSCLIHPVPCNDGTMTKENASLKAFLDKLAEGEMFMITDNLNLGGSLNVNLPILAMMGIPLPQVRLGISGGINSLWLRKVTFERTKDGLKVYTQHNKALTELVGFNFNVFLPIYKNMTNFKQADAKTKYFNIKLDEINPHEQNKAIRMIKSLFKTSSTELVEKYYPWYFIKNDFHSRLHNNRLLFFQWDKMKLKNEVKITPPKYADHDYDPAKYERTIYQEKIVNRHGTNWFNLFSETLSFFTKGWAPPIARANENPANTPFGRGRSFYVSTEAEITEGESFRPVSVIEDVFAGWSIRKNRLFKYFDKLEKKIANIPAQRAIFNRAVFNDTKKIELFEARTTLLLYPEAYDVLKIVIYNKNELNLYNTLISFVGLEEFKAFCDHAISSGFGDMVSYQGERKYQCMMPWMMEVFDLRKKGQITDKKELVGDINDMYHEIFRNAEWDRVLNFIGDKNYLFIVKIGGFRTNDEGAISSEGVSEYVSDTLGEFSKLDGAGVLRNYASDYGMSMYQLNASFFSEGF